MPIRHGGGHLRLKMETCRFQRRDIRLYVVESGQSQHDVDDGFGGEAWHGGAADVFDRAGVG
ncbi:hypothetical protein VA599_07070 [Chromobacterium sp. TRC.1.1.SA]|uniref:Uncharacterized protein n=1 Tax=Chromobacterium indicum TaxID=3110228 RepID=A0ABV0CHE0_9NEIS